MEGEFYLGLFGTLLLLGLVLCSQDGIGVHVIDGIQIPNLNLRVKGTNGNIVSRSLNSTLATNTEIEPFQAKREGGEHNIVVDIHVALVLLGLVVEVDLQMRNIVLCLCCEQQVVGCLDHEILLVLVFLVAQGNVWILAVGGVVCQSLQVTENVGLYQVVWWGRGVVVERKMSVIPFNNGE